MLTAVAVRRDSRKCVPVAVSVRRTSPLRRAPDAFPPTGGDRGVWLIRAHRFAENGAPVLCLASVQTSTREAAIRHAEQLARAVAARYSAKALAQVINPLDDQTIYSYTADAGQVVR